MNKKQICKVNYEVKPYGKEPQAHTQYGICVGDNTYLMEDGYVMDVKTLRVTSTHNLELFGNSNFSGSFRVESSSVSATRNVPPDIRERMEEAYTAFTNAMQAKQKFEKLKAMYEKEMSGYQETLKAFPTEIKHCRGILNAQEFLNAFMEALPEYVKAAMQAKPKVNYWGTKSGDYSVKTYGDNVRGSRIYIDTRVDIQKYFRESSFTFEEYDGTIMMTDDAEETPEYQQYIRKYSHPLPVKQDLTYEQLSVGNDKDFLCYEAGYEIEIKKPMTKKYAEELADKFSGREKVRENDDRER